MTKANKLSANFIEEIEKLVEGGSTHMDAIVTYCEKHGIEIETAAAIVRNNRKLKVKVRADAKLLGMVDRSDDGSRSQDEVA